MNRQDRYRQFGDYQQRENLDPVRGTSPSLSQPMPTLDANAAARGGPWEQLAAQALGTGNDLARLGLKVALEKQDEERALKATEILNTWRSNLNQFRAEYAQKNQGELAANAGAEFSAFARQSGNQVLDGIGDKKLRDMLMRSMSGVSMHFEETGLHYGNQQMEARKNNTLESGLAQLIQDAGQNAYNQEYIDFQKADYKQRLRDARVGFDTSADEAETAM